MKFNQVMALVMVIFFAIFAGGVVHTQASVEYAQVLEVVEIKDDLVYMIDWNGNEWIWEGAEDWNVGDFAAATMNTNGTEIIYDDIIVNLKYTRIAER
jgi:hypothetical protein